MADLETGIETGDATQSDQTQTQIATGDSISPEVRSYIDQYRKDAGLTKEPENTEEKEGQEADDAAKEAEKQVETEPKEGEPNPEEKETEDALKSPEGEDVKATRIADVKAWGREWQKTAEERQAAHTFVTDRFQGNMEEAEVAANTFDLIFSKSVEEFDPKEVLSNLAEVSRPRAEKLMTFLVENPAVQKQAEERVLSNLFGKDATSESLKEDLEGYKLFKEVGGLSALIGENDELPAQLQYDANGDPRSEEEINIFKNVLTELKSIKTERQTEAETKAAEAAKEKERQMTEAVSNYTEERFSSVNNAIKNLGLEIDEKKDTDAEKKEKTTVSRMIKFYATGMATESEEFLKVYKEATDAIKNGDQFTANRKKTILNKMVSDFTTDAVDMVIAKTDRKIQEETKEIEDSKETRKEVALGGGNEGVTRQRPKNETVEESIARLVREGKLGKDKF